MKNPVAYFKKVAQEKREYRAAMERVRALPEDYRFVYDKIQHYMWGHVAAFCDDLLAGAKTYRGTKQDALNRAIMGKLGNGRA